MATAVIQVRMSSRRLPGKALLPLGHLTSLEVMVERVRSSNSVDSLWLATSDDSSDNPLESLAHDMGVKVFRGDLEDVLSRFVSIAEISPAEDDLWIRLTGDCPLVCPEIIDMTVESIRGKPAEYVSNSIEPSFPKGLDVEVFKTSALLKAGRFATSKFDREHVTTWMIRNLEHPTSFPRLAPPRSDFRLTIDHHEDYEVVRAVFEALTRDSILFDCQEILRFLESYPDIASINQMHNQTQISDRIDPSSQQVEGVVI